MFISLLSYSREIADDDPLHRAHVAFVVEHINASRFLSAGKRPGINGGCLIVYGDDEQETRALLDQDPYVIDGVATYELHHVTVSLADPKSSLAG
ncbi:unannotated protein [freshwater metagenome]|uniref:Unannotated protein n=1 Tax=freshwater metagenome TaxID=449393 RepID=A0A6J7ETP1_9ZZZZ